MISLDTSDVRHAEARSSMENAIGPAVCQRQTNGTSAASLRKGKIPSGDKVHLRVPDANAAEPPDPLRTQSARSRTPQHERASRRLLSVLATCVIMTLAFPCRSSAGELEDLRRLIEEQKAQLEAQKAQIDALESRLVRIEDQAVIQDSTLKEIHHESEKKFEYNGYLRSGFGGTTKGGSMEVFMAPGAGGKYRLGNERDTVLELIFTNRFDMPWTANPSTYWQVKARPVFVIANQGNFADSEVSIREAYAEGIGLWANEPRATFWAGQRYYNRYDTYLNDFFYLDMSGFGSGIEDIDTGVGKLALAYLGGTLDRLDSNGNPRPGQTYAKHNLDLTLSGLAFLGGDLMLWLNGSHAAGQTTAAGVVVQEADGYAAAAVLKRQAGPFKNTLVVQFGAGSSSNFRTQAIVLDPNTTPELQADTEAGHTFRVVNFVDWTGDGRWQASASAVWQRSNNGAVLHSGSEWYSFGIRPVVAVSDFWSLAFEAGVDHTQIDGGPSGSLFKVTVAPQIGITAGLFGRPAIRFFTTYAWWTDQFRGLIAPDAFGDKTSGLTFGCQVEAWW